MPKKVNIFMLFGYQKQLLHNILPIEVHNLVMVLIEHYKVEGDMRNDPHP